MDLHIDSMSSTVHATDSDALRRMIRDEVARVLADRASQERAAADRQIRVSASAERPIAWE